MHASVDKRDIENLAILLQESESDIATAPFHQIFSNNSIWFCYHGQRRDDARRWHDADIDWFALTGRFLHHHKDSRLHFDGHKVELGFFIDRTDSRMANLVGREPQVRIHFRQYLKGYDAYDRLDVVLEELVGKEMHLAQQLRLFLTT